jgi:hypothetical protein
MSKVIYVANAASAALMTAILPELQNADGLLAKKRNPGFIWKDVEVKIIGVGELPRIEGFVAPQTDFQVLFKNVQARNPGNEATAVLLKKAELWKAMREADPQTKANDVVETLHQFSALIAGRLIMEDGHMIRVRATPGIIKGRAAAVTESMANEALRNSDALIAQASLLIQQGNYAGSVTM